MKTVTLSEQVDGARITLELNEFELTTLVALVEEGGKRLSNTSERTLIQERMEAVATEFTCLLGHLELPQSES